MGPVLLWHAGLHSIAPDVYRISGYRYYPYCHHMGSLASSEIKGPQERESDGLKAPLNPCANSFWKSGIVETLSNDKPVLMVTSGLPLRAPLPLLVVITTTPFDARIPYRAEAA